MRKILYLLIVSFVFISCKSSDKIQEVEVYNSENLRIYRLTDHVYKHISYLQTRDFGNVACNGMIVIDGNEAIVFDTPIDDASSLELIQWITREHNSKIVAVIPTYYHADNLGGLNEFHRQDIPSYALQKTIDIAKEKNYPLPQNAFDNFMELKVGNKNVYAEFLGEGHTADNIIGYFPAENILFGGCLVKSVDADKGNLEEANEQEWSETIMRLKQKYPDIRYIIPGHGKPGGVELLDYTMVLFQNVK